MAERRRLIVVSNRGPVSFAREDGERVARRGAGGLVKAALKPRRPPRRHLDRKRARRRGQDRRRGERWQPVDEFSNEGSPYRLRLVAHDPDAFHRFYNVVANPTLWFVQHYLWGLSEQPVLDHAFHAAWQEGYVAVNRTFARAVVAELERQPDAAVFFHDYHLYVAPALVRRAKPEATLSHFVHIPWPEPDSWTVLPGPIRRAVHQGLLTDDVVGFHGALGSELPAELRGHRRRGGRLRP